MVWRPLLAGFAVVLGLASAAAAQDPSQIWHYWGSGAELDAINTVIALSNKEYPGTPVQGK